MTASPGNTALAAKWKSMSIIEQLANVGSEVERSLRAHEGGNQERFNRALVRALELFDLTAADERWRGHRRREVLRTREEFCALFFGGAPNGTSRALQRYFLAFAVAARRARGD